MLDILSSTARRVIPPQGRKRRGRCYQDRLVRVTDLLANMYNFRGKPHGSYPPLKIDMGKAYADVFVKVLIKAQKVISKCVVRGNDAPNPFQ